LLLNDCLGLLIYGRKGPFKRIISLFAMLLNGLRYNFIKQTIQEYVIPSDIRMGDCPDLCKSQIPFLKGFEMRNLLLKYLLSQIVGEYFSFSSLIPFSCESLEIDFRNGLTGFS
jgi:hypothetical protein